jgi:hypothetical protein
MFGGPWLGGLGFVMAAVGGRWSGASKRALSGTNESKFEAVIACIGPSLDEQSAGRQSPT